MKSFLIATLLLSIIYISSAQPGTANYTLVDKTAMQIPDSMTHSTLSIARYIGNQFTNDEDKIRAAFIWVASTFTYDVNCMYTLRYNETPEDKITKPLVSHKGVCENYAGVFTDICKQMGLRSYVITGYTRQNGQTNYLAHAWSCVYTGGDWNLYDPTWASGYLTKGSFVKKLSNEYYAITASKMIRTHMPFDPMWEMLTQTINNKEFVDGTFSNAGKPKFSYKDSIAHWEQQTEEQQLAATLRRTEANSVNNPVVYERIKYLASEIEYHENLAQNKKDNDNVNLYNDATADYNKAVYFFNAYVDYRNRQFTPTKPDAEIQAMIDSADNRILSARKKVNRVIITGNITLDFLGNFKKTISDLNARVDEQKVFLVKYFSKGKLGRKTMFTKYTWMGMPLN